MVGVFPSIRCFYVQLLPHFYAPTLGGGRAYRFALVSPSENVVSFLALKVFDIASQNFTGMLISMCSYVPGVLLPVSFSHVEVMAPDFVKIGHFSVVLRLAVVSRLAPKVYDIQSQNFTGMLVSLCSSDPAFSHPDSSSHVEVMAPDLVKNCHFNVVLRIAPKVFDLEST